MINTPMDILDRFPVRRSGKQKQAFRDAVESYAGSLGYRTKIEKGTLGCRNIIIGDPETAQFLITAHYDTPVGLWMPQFLVPCNLFLFILAQMAMAVGLFLPAAVVTAMTAWLAPGAWYPVMVAMLALTLILMLAGPANRNNANNNSSGVIALLETAASMPRNLRKRVCFALLDLEEPGLLGSGYHRKKHRYATDLQTVLNLECVGDGDTVMFIPNRQFRADPDRMDCLLDLERSCGEKRVVIRDKGFAYVHSAQMQFPWAVAVCATHKKIFCHYTGRLNTRRDTVLDYTNINILRACLITFIGSAHSE